MSINFNGSPEEIMCRAAELGGRLNAVESQFKETVGQGVFDEEGTLNELTTQIQAARSSYEEMRSQVGTIEGLDGEVEEVFSQTFAGIDDTLQRLETNRGFLEKQVQVITFENRLRDVYAEFGRISPRKARGENDPIAYLQELEKSLRSRITTAFCHAVLPEHRSQVEAFRVEIEKKYTRHFQSEFNAISSSFSGTPSEDFNRLLPLMSSLGNFISTRKFYSEDNQRDMEALLQNISQRLEFYVEAQKQLDLQTNAQLQAATDLRNRLTDLLTAIDRNDQNALKELFPKLGQGLHEPFFQEIKKQLPAARQRSINSGCMRWMSEGKDPITSYATKEQCITAVRALFPADVHVEAVAEQMEEDLTAIRLSLVSLSPPNATTSSSESDKGKEPESDVDVMPNSSSSDMDGFGGFSESDGEQEEDF